MEEQIQRCHCCYLLLMLNQEDVNDVFQKLVANILKRHNVVVAIGT